MDRDPNDPLGVSDAFDGVQRAIKDAQAYAIVTSSSDLDAENSHIQVLADGSVWVFSGSQVSRTEITTGRHMILVHKNPDGIYGAGRFNRIEIRFRDAIIASLNMQWDEQSSYTNPLYVTKTEEGEVIGRYGYGQQIDLAIAAHYYPGQNIGSGGNHLDASVYDWLDAKLGRGFE